MSAQQAHEIFAARNAERYPRLSVADYAVWADAAEEIGECDLAQDLRLMVSARTRDMNETAAIERAYGLPFGTLAESKLQPPPSYRWHNDAGREWAAEVRKWLTANQTAIARAARAVVGKARNRMTADQLAVRAARRADRKDADAARKGISIRERIRDAASGGELVTAEPGGRRLRVRAVSVAGAVASAREKALAEKKWKAVCYDGGGVANSYGYSAQTECVLAVSDPRGRVVAWFCRRPANKVTAGGAAAGCFSPARPLFDSRYGAAAEHVAWREIKRVHRLLIAGGFKFRG